LARCQYFQHAAASIGRRSPEAGRKPGR
jgi:hypothetical protein